MREKKIVMVSPQLGIAPESNSGGEVYDRELIKAWDKKGIEQHVFLPRGKKVPKLTNTKTYRALLSFMFPPVIFNFFVFFHLVKLRRLVNFKIVRVHSPYFVGVGAYCFGKFNPDVKLITTYHHLEDSLMFDVINKWLIKKWDAVVVDSQFTKKQIIKKYGLGEKNLIVIPCGLRVVRNKGQIKTVRRNWGLDDNDFVLLFLGGLKKRKNIGFLIRILSRVASENVKLLIAGSGSERRHLEALVEERKLEKRVIFTGFVEENQKSTIYQMADMVVSASKLEGFGMTVTEAYAHSKPVMVSDKGSLPELVDDGKTGYVVPLKVSLWVGVIERVNKERKPLEQMGLNAYQKSKSYSWDKTADKYLQIVRSLA